MMRARKAIKPTDALTLTQLIQIDVGPGLLRTIIKIMHNEDPKKTRVIQ